MRKIITSLAVIFILTSAYTAFAADVKAPSAYDANSPDATREKFCDLAYNVLNIRMGTELTEKTGIFTDTDKPEINTLAEAGIIDGRGNGIFDPQGKITREEAARIFCSMMDYMGIEDMNVVDETFKDFDTVSDWAKEYVAKVGRNEIMEGNGDGYEFNAGNGYYNTPSETFHLYNSDFGPHQNYTVWQTQATLYRLSNRLPEKMEGETVTDLGGGVKLADNWKYTYAEKDGHVTFCMPHGEKYFLAERGEGQPVLGHNESVYDLATGERLKKFQHSLYDMTNVYAVTKTYIDMSFVGFTNDTYYCFYDFEGNIINTYSGGYSDSPKKEFLTDPNGGEHYIFENDDGKYLTEIYSTKPIVAGKRTIDENIEDSNCFVCTVGDKDNPTYQVYDFDGTLLYEGMREAFALGQNNYMVHKDGGGFEVYSSETNEKKFDAEGDYLKNSKYSYTNLPVYFVTYKKNEDWTDENYSVYSYDGSVREEGLLNYAENGPYDGTRYIMANYSDKLRFINVEDMSLYKEIEGSGYYTRKYMDESGQLFIQRLNDGNYVLCDLDLNPITNVGNRYLHTDTDYNCIIAYPEGSHDDNGQDRYSIYSLRDGSLRCEFVGEKIESGHYYTDNYVMTDCDSEYRLYNMNDTSHYIPIEKKKYTTYSGEEEYKIRFSEHNNIVGIGYERFTNLTDILELYDSDLNKIYTGDHAIDWNERYVAKLYHSKAGAELYRYDGSETGIVSRGNWMYICTVNGKERILTENNNNEITIYDGDTLQPIKSLDYDSVRSEGDRLKFRNYYNGGDVLNVYYTDENGVGLDEE